MPPLSENDHPKTIKILKMTPKQNGQPPSQVINDQPLWSEILHKLCPLLCIRLHIIAILA